MGYACPVCGGEQPDGEHLANHLAFTAMLRSDDHADWLDDHVAGWPDMDPETLAPAVTPHAPEVETEVVTEEGAHPAGIEGEAATHGGYGRDALSPDQQAVLDEAQALTREMYGLDDAADPRDSAAKSQAATDEGADESSDTVADEAAEATETAGDSESQ